MKVLVIGHPETVLGFSLVGVQGQAASTADEANRALDGALAAPDVGIVLITMDVAELIEVRSTRSGGNEHNLTRIGYKGRGR